MSRPDHVVTPPDFPKALIAEQMFVRDGGPKRVQLTYSQHHHLPPLVVTSTVSRLQQGEGKNEENLAWVAIGSHVSLCF